ncbi:hypothetical protein C7B67_29215 [filamentous cyanobacterium Phorm 6]|nr:hypothetical protein C7B67_29215 [filamentous cyanobacterium Phorm 6]
MAIWDLGWFARLIIGETHLFGADEGKFFVGAARNWLSRISRGGQKPGFFENSSLQPKNCEKPGFFGLVCLSASPPGVETPVS